MSLYRGDFESNVGRVVEAAEFFVIFVWVPVCRRASPGDRIAVDTVETGEQQPPRAGRISSKSGVSRSGGVWPCFRMVAWRFHNEIKAQRIIFVDFLSFSYL